MFIKKGRKTIAWEIARKELKDIYFKKGITTCELRLSGCWYDNALSFAHRYKRNDPKCKHTFDQTLLLCVPCHQKIENDRKLTEKVFNTLR